MKKAMKVCQTGEPEEVWAAVSEPTPGHNPCLLAL